MMSTYPRSKLFRSYEHAKLSKEKSYPRSRLFQEHMSKPVKNWACISNIYDDLDHDLDHVLDRTLEDLEYTKYMKELEHNEYLDDLKYNEYIQYISELKYSENVFFGKKIINWGDEE